MFETIITEAFFLPRFAFTNIHDSQEKTTVGRGRCDLFNSSWWTNVFGQKIYGEFVLNGKTNDQIMSKWGRSFIMIKCIF